MKEIIERQERELALLRKQVAAGGGGGGLGAASGMAKQKKPKRQANGEILNSSPTKKAGRDLLNPSQPAPKKKKAIQYKGLASATPNP